MVSDGGPLPSSGEGRDVQPVDGPPGEAEQRGQQGQRGPQDQQDGEDHPDREPVHERQAGDQQAEQRDDDRAAG